MFSSNVPAHSGSVGSATPSGEPVTVSHVDLNRYVGTWYEIAKIPNPFQRKCAMNTTATYSLRSDGRIEVVNRCVEADGSENIAKGVAKVVDTVSNAKLEVSFVRILGLQLFWGDYWIIGLDKDYKYAVVGTPSRKYGWILGRAPQLSKVEMDTINDILRTQGYNPNDFVPTDQATPR
jgi:apolipoprotein D and lipocalin family protein